ncbi:MAG TPA: acyltransferase [Anaeromyxobacteraceae bacterium]|jgi:peptidoglycan/LPS O-acetylase OafA/YrhL|nr:acyltransferase [Anaeromyxobacteraceae bacterium]
MRDGRIPSLDGLRAVSAGLVVAGHAAEAVGAVSGLRGLYLVRAAGSMGVTVFFVVSGFLITTLLDRERARTGTIRLGAFWLRRAFRILPAYWAFLSVMACLAAAGAAHIPLAYFSRTFFFLSDYLTLPGHWWLGHLWSLSAEEQFYLLWPPALLLLGRRRALGVALGLVLAAPLLRLATYLVTPGLRSSIAFMLHTRIDALMLGCALALLRAERPDAGLLRALARGPVALAAAVYLFVGAPLLFRAFAYEYRFWAGFQAEAVAAGAVLLWASSHPRALAGRALNSAPLVHLGQISFGLYLWQQPFLNRELGWPPALVLAGAAAALVVAELSRRLVEEPAQALRARLERLRPLPVPCHDHGVDAAADGEVAHHLEEARP